MKPAPQPEPDQQRRHRLEVSEADERRAAAARYREIGSRMMNEASYAESHGFQVSSDMSNLIQDRYEALQREHPEWHLPDIANPRLDYRDMAPPGSRRSTTSWTT